MEFRIQDGLGLRYMGRRSFFQIVANSNVDNAQILEALAPRNLACEQALCLGKNSEEREGEGGREPVDKHLRPLFRLL